MADGATPSVLPALLPKALTILGSNRQASMIEIVEDLDQSLGPQLRTGKIDLIVGPVHEPFTATPDIVETELLVDPFCIAVGMNSPFADRNLVSLEELVGATWPSDCIYANIEALNEAATQMSKDFDFLKLACPS